jgi:hypothetical protein
VDQSQAEDSAGGELLSEEDSTDGDDRDGPSPDHTAYDAPTGSCLTAWDSSAKDTT